ncbi:hypothetical protein [Nocardia asiatica]|uniref:hypothetical protein n=1 Tax=Nocardia asiatica TaxID=209252 RepID=UPI0024538B8B|nr:hypothetical protein [Nocardia asiatica]
MAYSEVPAAREQLADGLRARRWPLLAAVPDVSELPADAAAALIADAADHVTGILANARAAGYGDSTAMPRRLALLKYWHPRLAHWDPLLELLSEPLVQSGDKFGALQLLGALDPSVIDPVVRTRLAEIAVTIPTGLPGEWDLPWQGNAGAAARRLAAHLGVLEPAAAATALAQLLAGAAEQCIGAVWLAYELGRPEDLGILLTLAHDAEADVRAAAASALRRFAGGRGNPAVETTVRQLARDPGITVARALVSVLDASHDNEVLAELGDHIAASVRIRAAAGS